MDPIGTSPSEMERRLDELATAYLKAREAGQAPDRQALLDHHPDLSAELRAFFADQDRFDRLAAPVASADGLLSGVLGDFRIIREVGRGGMGVVYEAEQVSLGRRVALKVLPLAATMDPRHLQRFQNEARAAACLHHANIVPVHGVGCERGVYFYAMQFIDGCTLAEVIRRPSRPAEATDTASEASSARETVAAASTLGSSCGPAYYRRVAEVGIQAAEALEHAHQMGVVHRDVKPANLMLDGHGCLWVTDFGLAQVQTDVRVTRTGDMVGTLRYMSPEQALGGRGVVDQRADIYSLGVTLYELLAHQAPFAGDDRRELLRQIAFEEPRPPRRINRIVPAELETIALKAMEKDPAGRYATAQEMADDLRLWLVDKPIRAKRSGIWARAQKWSRRHKSAVRAMVLGLVVAVVGLAFSTGWAWYQKKQTDDARQYADGQRVAAVNNATEADMQRLRADENFRKAVATVNGLLARANDPQLPRTPETARVREALAKDAMPFIQELLKGENDAGPDGRMLTALACEGLGTAHSIRGELVEAAEAYARAREICKRLAAEFPAEPAYAQELKKVREVLLTVANAEGLAQNLAEAGEHQKAVKALRDVRKIDEIIGTEINGSSVLLDQAQSGVRLADELRATGQLPEAEQAYGDALTSCDLLAGCPPNEVYPAFVQALKIRAQCGRGVVQAASGHLDKAEENLRLGLGLLGRLKPDELEVAVMVLKNRTLLRSTLGNVLWATGRRPEAADAFRAAAQEWRQAPNNPVRDNQLAWFLVTCPDVQFRNATDAVDLARQAVQGIPEGDPWRVVDVAYYRAGDCRRALGVALYRAGDWNGAVEALNKGAALRQGGDSSDWFFLAMAHWHLGEKDEATSWYHKAIVWMDKNKPQDEELLRFRAEAAELLGAKQAGDKATAVGPQAKSSD